MTSTARPIPAAWTNADWHTRARACHSLVSTVPVGQDAGAVRKRLQSASDRWPDLAGAKLWEASALAREARRPIGITSAAGGVRLVFVHQPDGSARLVIVAIRSYVPLAMLLALAADLCGTADPGELTSISVADEPVLSAGAAVPPWGFGNQDRVGLTGTVVRAVESAEQVDARVLRAAATLVWSRYAPDEVQAAGLHPRAGQTVASFLAMFDKEADVESPAVRVWYQNSIPGCSYLPCLTPVSPLTVMGNRQVDGSLEITCWYDEGAISASIARDFAEQTARIASELVSVSADSAVAAIGSLTHEEAVAVLRLGGAGVTRQQVPARKHTIHERFTEVADRRDSAVAVSDGRTALTYRDVEERAERIAWQLWNLGVRHGDLIGVSLEPDAMLIVALLAVLKCGCTYVPMDVRHPPERLRSTAADAGLRVVLAEQFPEIDGVRVVSLPELEQFGQGASHDDPATADRTSDGTDSAYVIYTSGSTGGPKGAAVPHSNVLALIDATEPDFALGPDDVWTMFHSSAFDFAVWEMWGCLLTGGRLVVVPYWVTRSADEFRELLLREGVTVLSQTPSAFSQLMTADQEQPPELAVRLVVFGGEPLDSRVLLPWVKRYALEDCRVVNMFGITETTVHVTSHTVTPLDVVSGTRNVGRAIPGWGVSVRDPDGRVLPIGAVGEIWVSGPGVASHYLGRPELTAQRFVTDPVSGERCYRSGDLGRMRPDGALDHLGRLDRQVKIRGHRIELDEIRSVLLNEPQVSAAVTVVRQDVPDDPATLRIHAYVVLRTGTTLTGILANARRYLPDYMVPFSLTAVDSLPLTVNGKLDVERLPAVRAAASPDGLGGQTRQVRDDDLTARLLTLWRQHLNTEVKVDDNFFELGGNSLLVTRLLADLRKQGFPRISLRSFYQNSTASQFVELVRQVSTADAGRAR